jgi:hypothetical protein
MANSFQSPVAGEPSLGTLHLVTEPTTWNVLSAGSATTWTDVDISALVPVGAKAVKMMGVATGTTNVAGNLILGGWLRKNGSASAGTGQRVGMAINPCINGTYYEVWGEVTVGLDSSRIFEYYNSTTGTSARSFFLYLIGYYC